MKAVSLAIPSVLATMLAAQTAPPPAPVPAQILSAKRVFVANAGSDSDADPDRGYNGLYAAIKAWGWYELVGAPSDADLLFEIRFTLRPGDVTNGTSFYNDARLRLTIRDPRTHAILWAFTESMRGPGDKSFDQALAKIVGRMQLLTPPPAAPAGASK